MAACEDYPCCGHELGDCNGQKYGSDESIKDAVRQSIEAEWRWNRNSDADYDY